MRHLFVAVTIALALAPPAAGEPNRRRTRVVDVFEACKDSVVAFTSTRTERKPATTKPKAAKAVTVKHVQRGSGFVLHEDGYLIVNSHALKLRGRRTVTFIDGKSYPIRVIANDKPHDLALVQITPPRRVKPLRLGSSADVMVGEPAIVIGDPHNVGMTVSAGIVSAVGRSTKTEYTLLSDMIQTDASINPGSSGGPVLNADGEVIGVVTSVKRDASGIGYATPIDTVRRVLPQMIAAERRYGFVLGLEVAVASPAAVTKVAAGSPAHAAGIKVGDVVIQIDKTPVRRGIDFHLALIGRKGGTKLSIGLRRDGKVIRKTVTLGKVAPVPAREVTGLSPGLKLEVYGGKWKKLPDFSRYKPVATTASASFTLGPHKSKDGFALRFTGYLDAPTGGVYVFYTESDDGSRLYIGDRLVVDNDGPHPPIERRGFISLCAGKHPIRVTFFEANGEESLTVSYEGPGIEKQEIPTRTLSRPTGA